MPTANVQIKKILVGRGNTTISSNYSGVRGEITMDTGLNTLRIHDGTTVGGTRLATYAELANVSTGTYSNTNVAAYLVANPQGSTYSNANVQAYIGANVGAYQTWANATLSTVANAGTQQTSINNLSANIGAYQAYANANVGTISTTLTNLHANVGAYEAYANLTFSTVANAGTQATDINTLRANVTAANSAITTANTGMKSYVDAVTTAWTANAGTQATEINGLRANITAANTAIVTANTGMKSYVDAVTTAWTANAGTQQIEIAGLRANITAANSEIATLQTQVYSNTNTAAYLAGNVITGNLTVAYNAVVLGNLQVNGTQTTVNTATLNVTDLYVTVANGAINSAAANGAGLRVAGALANIAYSSISDSFEFNKPITANLRNAGNIAFSDGTFMTTSWVANAGTQQTQIDNFNANLGAYQIYANSAISNPTVANLDNNGFQVTLDSTGVTTFPGGGQIGNIAYIGPGLSTGIIDANGIVLGTGFANDIKMTQGSDTEFWVNNNQWSFGTTGNLTVPSSILPTVDNTQDLGSATQRFRHLYVGPGTVYIGNAAIKSTLTGNLILPGVTRAVANTAYADEVYEEEDQEYSFATVPTVIDNARYSDLSGRVNGLSFTPAEYSVDQLDGDGYH
jgi:hypothetical protein